MAQPAYRTADATVSAYDARAVTLSDSTVLAPTRALYIGAGGNLKVTMAYGTEVTFVGLSAGSILPIQVTKCFATGSTAASILALY
jgi:hypothetical protein